MVSVQFPSCVTKMFAPSAEKQFAKAIFSAPTNTKITAAVADAFNWIKEFFMYTGSNREVKRTLNAVIANPNDKNLERFLASVAKATARQFGSTASVATVAKALVNNAPRAKTQAAVIKLIQNKFHTSVWTPYTITAAISSAALAGAGVAVYLAPEKTIERFIPKAPEASYFTATTITCSVLGLAAIAAGIKYRAAIGNCIVATGSVIRHPINSLQTARAAASDAIDNAKATWKAWRTPLQQPAPGTVNTTQLATGPVQDNRWFASWRSPLVQP